MLTLMLVVVVIIMYQSLQPQCRIGGQHLCRSTPHSLAPPSLQQSLRNPLPPPVVVCAAAADVAHTRLLRQDDLLACLSACLSRQLCGAELPSFAAAGPSSSQARRPQWPERNSAPSPRLDREATICWMYLLGTVLKPYAHVRIPHERAGDTAANGFCSGSCGVCHSRRRVRLL